MLSRPNHLGQKYDPELLRHQPRRKLLGRVPRSIVAGPEQGSTFTSGKPIFQSVSLKNTDPARQSTGIHENPSLRRCKRLAVASSGPFIHLRVEKCEGKPLVNSVKENHLFLCIFPCQGRNSRISTQLVPKRITV